MAAISDVEVVVFDVLGTLADDVGGLRRESRAVLPGADDAYAEELLGVWLRHVAAEQRRIARGERPYASSTVIDAEAAHRVAAHAGLTDPAAISRLATAGRRPPPFPDAVAGLDHLARRFAVVALSNASRTALLHLTAHAGLRWHHALSAETVGAYKPAPAAYRLAIDAADRPPDRMLMVAAHAWDLRGAQAVGMRTAYVHRAEGDPPADSDTFDGRFADLDELAAALG